MSNSANRRENRLAKSSSAYLRQHGHNPVDWFPWGEEALAKSKNEDKPILLSIGYSACHWCHVMERESFENDYVAGLMNEHFVPIKVDREERPDLDQIYQMVVQLLGKGGGWPLTVFLTPEQRPFYGGTYFPPQPRYGMPSFAELLLAIRDAYEKRREDVTLQSQEIAEAISKVSEVGRNEKTPAYSLGPDLLARVTKKLSSRFDDEHGGFGSKPKFPSTMNVEVLLRRAYQERDGEAEARAKKALDGMRQGGIWDHLGGGFHRYSTDEKWLVPHFEKMLYDNGQLMRLYLDASRAFQNSGYQAVASDIGDYLLREMQHESGAFYATQDADSEGEEGKFFVWTKAHVDAAVSDPKAREIVKSHFGITDEGNFEESNATVLSEVTSIDRIAIRLEIAPSTVVSLLEKARAEMFAARELRPKPFRDEKMLACWNGLAIGPLAELGAITGDERFTTAAHKAFRDIVTNMTRGGRVARYRIADGTIVEPGYLDDHANLGNAALDLYEATGDTSAAEVAKHIADQILQHFADPNSPGFYLSPSDGEKLLVRMKDPYDQATPSAAAMAAMLLLRLGVLLGDRYHAPAARYLESVAAAAVDNPFGFGQTICALDRLVRGSIDIVIVGHRDREDTHALRRAVLAAYVPNRTLAVIDPHHPTTKHVASALAEGKPAPKDGHAIAYVCRGRTCSLPVSTAAELTELLRA